MKQAYFFSHDSNAKDDPKCSMLIEQLGCEGYGIYWILVETLRDQPSYKYPLNMLPILARKYNTTHEKVKVVVGNYGLFIVDDSEFFSLSLCKRMERMDNLLVQRKLAGIASGERRKLLSEGIKNEQSFNECSTSDEQKKRKEKKPKENKVIYGSQQNILLTEAEYERLKKEFPLLAEPAIEYLSSWIVEKNYVSKSHNLAIRRWVIDAVKKKQPTQLNQSNPDKGRIIC